MKEMIKDIKGYEGLYQISKTGFVTSLARRNQPERILRTIKRGGLEWCKLCKNGFYERVWIHKLIEGHFDDYEN